MLKKVLVVAGALSLAQVALANPKAATKEKWHCVDAEGKEVADVTTKEACAAPNEWKVVAADAKTAAPAAKGKTEAHKKTK